MPMAWRATQGRLEVIESAMPMEEPVIADYERHPFHLIKGSIGTPPEGIEARLIREEDLDAGADARGAFILINPEERPACAKLRKVCAAGALGLVSDYLAGRYEMPGAIHWVNACTHGPSWHTRADDPPFIGYTVSPVVGDQLRKALRQGPVKVRAFCDGERYEGKVEAVTGVIPGEEAREIWIMAHLYEPMADDNSSGVACALEIAHVLRRLYENSSLPRPRFTVRFLFAMEAYGFAAYAQRRGGWLGDQVLCALNLDTLPILKDDREVDLCLSQSSRPSSGDYLLESLLQSHLMETPLVCHVRTEGVYGDDRVLADSTIGVPTLWVRAKGRSTATHRRFWHHSGQTMDRIAPAAFRDIAALYGTWLACMLDSGAENLKKRIRRGVRISCNRLEEEYETTLKLWRGNQGAGRESLPVDWLEYRLEIESARLRDFLRFGAQADQLSDALAQLAAVACRLKGEIEAPSAPSIDIGFHDKIWALAQSIVITRKTRGLPHDLAAAPPEDRRLSLGTLAYGGPLALLLVHGDGRRDAADLLLRAQWEERSFYSPQEVRKCLGSLQYLARYGYIDLKCSHAVTEAQLVETFRAAGIREGDLLLLHGGLAALGVVEGGAESVIRALRAVLGETGTLLMPAFTHSILCFEKGPAGNRNLVPFHPKRASTWVGAIAETFRKQPGVLRSAHLSHSVAGIGPLAQACLSGHGATDAPAGATSPWAKLHEYKGKIAFLGAGLGSCTFLHYLETIAGVDYLESSICVADEEGAGRRLATVPQNLPGRRDFYGSKAEQSKIFRWLAAHGLKIERLPVGFGELKVIEAAQLHHLGLKALDEDPAMLL